MGWRRQPNLRHNIHSQLYLRVKHNTIYLSFKESLGKDIFEDLLSKVSSGLDGVVSELLKAAQNKIKEKLAEAFSIHKLEKLRDNIARVGKVKTILNPDSIVDLEDIFIESAVAFNDIENHRSIDSFRSKHVLIEGGPGQGKSLYLKHLCLNEGARANYIPIFIEFRYLKYEKNLREELFEAIKDFGVELDDGLFDYLAKSKKILFILDGFDEIPSSSRHRVSKELELIARTYPDLKIVISSRPDSGMGSSVYFKKYKITYLEIKQQTAFIEHLYSNASQALDVINILRESSFVAEVTNTPLLLTLFAITYNARQFKPDSLSEFYSLIFPTMLYRHDRMKIGYERERKSRLTDYQMQRLFEVFSFISLKDNKTRFSSSKFREYLELSSRNERLDENLEDKLIEDITQITGLIVPDGFDDYSFSHKSIQEWEPRNTGKIAKKRGFQFNGTTEIRSGVACLPCHRLFLILKSPLMTNSGALCLSTGKSGFNTTGL